MMSAVTVTFINQWRGPWIYSDINIYIYIYLYIYLFLSITSNVSSLFKLIDDQTITITNINNRN